MCASVIYKYIPTTYVLMRGVRVASSKLSISAGVNTEGRMGKSWIVLPSWVLVGLLSYLSGCVESTVPAAFYPTGGCRLPAYPGNPNRPRCCDGWELVQRSCVPACPRGYTMNGLAGCWRLVHLAASWADARMTCQQDNQSDLAIIDSKEEFVMMLRLARAWQLDMFWIGLREVPLVKSLVWVDGSQLTLSDDLATLIPKPRPILRPFHTASSLPSHSCVGINLTSGAMKLVDCAKTSAFMCETRSYCPRGFTVDSSGHCYRYVSNQPTPWSTSRADCRTAPGGDLAVIDKEPSRESQLLLERVRPEVTDLWIGLYSEAPLGVWRWVDGSTLTESVWKAGEPTNLHGPRNCAKIDFNARWSNADCSRNLSYVCEIQENGECFTSRDGSDYMGHVNITATGDKCSSWNRDSLSALNVGPISDAVWSDLVGHNYCRNPGGLKDWVGCIGNRHDGSPTWKSCYVGEPQVTCIKDWKRTMPRSFATPCTNRHACDRGRTCHPVVRKCICPSGYAGDYCGQPCASGKYGYDCDFHCPPCPAGGACHHVTGDCPHTNEGDVADSLGANPPLTCGGICGLAVRVGCVCDSTNGSCPCPAYVVALVAIVIATWVVLGFACLACGIIRRRRTLTRVEYKRDSDYCEEIGTDSDTDDELDNQQVSGQPTKEIVCQPPVGTAVGIMDNFESSTAVLLHNAQHVRPSALPTAPPLPMDSPADDSPPPSPFYLNVTRYRDETEYSDPYELLGREPIWRRSAPGPDEVWEPFLFRPVTNIEELNDAPNGYVNDSVIKLKEKRRTNRGNHVPYRLRFSFRSKELGNKAAASAAGETQRKRTFKQKPPLKPKPDNIKLRPFSGKNVSCTRPTCDESGTLSRRSDPQSSAIRHDEFELQIIGRHSPTTLTRHSGDTRRHKLQRGTSVPNSGTCCQENRDLASLVSWPWQESDEKSEGHVYVNEKIGRPRVSKARSVDEFGV